MLDDRWTEQHREKKLCLMLNNSYTLWLRSDDDDEMELV